MVLDLGLALAHHVLVFGLAAMLMAQLTVMRGPVIDIRRIKALDAGAGITSGLVLIVGFGRVFLGGKGWAYYEANPFFWAKLATFILIGLVSIVPTLTVLRWARAHKADAAYAPPASEVTKARRALRIMALLVLPLLAFAAAMARWPF